MQASWRSELSAAFTVSLDMEQIMGTKKQADITLGGKAVSAQIFFRAPGAAGSAPDTRTRLQRRAQVTESVRRAVVERIRANNAAGAQQFDVASRQNDMVALFVEDAARNGVDGNDVADVAALYWITAWSVVHRHAPTTPEIAAVRAQVRGALAQAPELLAASDDEKQEMADDMIFQLMLLQAAFEQARARKDDAALSMLAQSTWQTALQNKVDLRAMRLGDDGLVEAPAARAMY
jgi:hypothetical protein